MLKPILVPGQLARDHGLLALHLIDIAVLPPVSALPCAPCCGSRSSTRPEYSPGRVSSCGTYFPGSAGKQYHKSVRNKNIHFNKGIPYNPSTTSSPYHSDDDLMASIAVRIALSSMSISRIPAVVINVILQLVALAITHAVRIPRQEPMANRARIPCWWRWRLLFVGGPLEHKLGPRVWFRLVVCVKTPL